MSSSFPRQDTETILQALGLRGENRGEYYAFTCPLHASKKRDSACVYYNSGMFVCYSGSCEKRHITKLYQELNNGANPYVDLDLVSRVETRSEKSEAAARKRGETVRRLTSEKKRSDMKESEDSTLANEAESDTQDRLPEAGETVNRSPEVFGGVEQHIEDSDPRNGWEQITEGKDLGDDFLLEEELDISGTLVDHWPIKVKEKTVMIVVRTEGSNGKKKDIPYTLWYKKGYSADSAVWLTGALKGVKYPLYNSEHLSIEDKDAPVILFEGQKDAAEMTFALKYSLICVGYYGGAKNSRKSDFGVLSGRVVYFCYDNDDPGILAIPDIQKLSEEQGFKLHVVKPPAGVEKGGNIADVASNIPFEERNDNVISDLILDIQNSENHVAWDDLSGMINAAENNEKRRAARAREAALTQPSEIGDHGIDISRAPIIPICMVGGIVSIYVEQDKSIVHIDRSNLGSGVLVPMWKYSGWLEIAPNRNDPTKVNWNGVSEAIREVAALHQVSPPVRGNGCWREGDDIIINCGNKIYKNGEETTYRRINEGAEFLYTGGKEVPYYYEKKLDAAQRSELLGVLACQPFAQEIHKELLAGFMAAAPYCGLFEWRSNMWMTAEFGTGKTFIFNQIVQPMLTNTFGAFLDGTLSTPVGFRNACEGKATVIVLDEAESENKKKAEDIKQIIASLNASSAFSGSGSEIVMGKSGGGHGVKFSMKPMVLCASIAHQMDSAASLSRFTMVSIVKFVGNMEEKLAFYNRSKEAVKLLTPEWCKAFYAGMTDKVDQLLKSIDIMTDTLFLMLDLELKRPSEQLGVFLGGYWMIAHDAAPTEEEARAFIEPRLEALKNSSHVEDSTKSQILQLLNHTVQVYGDSNSLLPENKTVMSCLEHVIYSRLGEEEEREEIPVEKKVAENLVENIEPSNHLTALNMFGINLRVKPGIKVVNGAEVGARVLHIQIADRHTRLKKAFLEKHQGNYGEIVKRWPHQIACKGGHKVDSNKNRNGNFAKVENKDDGAVTFASVHMDFYNFDGFKLLDYAKGQNK